MTASIISSAVSFTMLAIAALIIRREIATRWSLIAEALAFREPGYVRVRQVPVSVSHSAA